MITLHHGDALDVLAALPNASVDAIVTDPPAGIAFMGKEWDDFRRSRNPADAGRDDVFGRTSRTGPEYARGGRAAFVAAMTPIFVECLRVLRPGGRAFVWSIPRTSHWTACAVEDAGFVIENTVAHVFGSGFPKGKGQLKPAYENWIMARKHASVCSCECHVRFAESPSSLTPRGSLAGADSVAPMSAGSSSEATAAETRTTIGRAGAGSGPTGTSQSDSAESGFGLNINSSPNKRSGGRSSRAKTSTTSTESATTTAPKTLKCCPCRSTQESTAPAASGIGRDDIILARKPGGKVQPLQIDACRVGFASSADERESKGKNQHGDFDSGPMTNQVFGEFKQDRDNYDAPGRWPPNLVLSHADGCERVGEKRVRGDARQGGGLRIGGFVDVGANKGDAIPCAPGHADADGLETVADWRCVEGCPVKLMGEQSGVTSVTGKRSDASRNAVVAGTTWGADNHRSTEYAGDTGTAARFFPQLEPDPPPFFYAAKASRRERNAGCEGLPERASLDPYNGGEGLPGRSNIGGEWQNTNAERMARANVHPTVKPQALMRWLCRLITPPGGTVLDCFAGSGSTLVACVAEGFNAIGIEREAEYVEIARARVAHAEAEARAAELGQRSLPFG